MEDKTNGRIVNSGMGGFLNPPEHPEHFYSVKQFGPDYFGGAFSMSLSSAVECDWLLDSVKAKAKAVLDQWIKPELESEAVQDWICRCLGYFKNCYSKDGVGRNVNTDLIVSKEPLDVNRHLGVMHIRKFYPEYIPSEKDFEGAYWGAKGE